MKIQEIAKLAGVSTATVSRAFSHNPNVRESVKKHIFDIAAQYGYRPRLSVQNRNIAVIIPYKSVYPVQSYVEMMLTELIHELPNHDYRIEIIPQENLAQLERTQFCAAIGIGAAPEYFLDWDKKFAAPLIIVDRNISSLPDGVYSVYSDETQAMELAIAHFAENGMRKIGAIVYGIPGEGNTEIRCKSIRKALIKYDFPHTSSLIRVALEDAYIEEIGKLLKNDIDALFCPGGNAGLVAAYALSLYNRKIPEDISLITSERTMFSRYAVPPQTTISQDYTLLAQKIVNVVNDCLSGKKVSKITEIPYKLISRDSVKLVAD